MEADVQQERDARFPAYEQHERAADNRTPAQRDRDRVLYSSALRRLTNVTQVASAIEGPSFHNRLTHTFEVAQVARRIAEMLSADGGRDYAYRALGGLDPDVVETAALAHDLGHPPFGHIGEEELDAAVAAETKEEGFEGNAQSLRIVTRLSLRHPRFPGLNLTRASLNAILKYPWTWDDRPADKPNKWGAYETEREFFDFARGASTAVDQVASLEASIMDWSDDIAYAVHDVEDFYRAGLIPLDVLALNTSRGDRERERFVAGILARYARRERTFPYGSTETRQATDALFEFIRSFGVEGRYDGTPGVRRSLRTLTAGLIARYVMAGATLGSAEQPLKLNTKLRREVSILKELTWHYVIEGPDLATQQQGQRRIVRDLFATYHAAIRDRSWWLLPTGFAAVVEEAYTQTADEATEAARLAADLVSGLTEHEAVVLHQRLTGVSMGPLLGALRPR